MENSEPKPSRTSWREHLQALGRDAVAGGVASIIIVATIVSFGTLMFPGDLAAGAASAVWAMLAGAAICGAWIALKRRLKSALQQRSSASAELKIPCFTIGSIVSRSRSAE